MSLPPYYHIKGNVKFHEYNMHTYIYNTLGTIINVPRIIKYDRKAETMTMQLIPSMSIADFYGEEYEVLPVRISEEIQRIVRELRKHNITYPDITGYNFIEHSSKVWIIDFEHCYFNFKGGNDFEGDDDFVEKFAAGKVSTWNPEYK